MHFTYGETVKGDLKQGDLLERNDTIDAILEKYYPRYYENRNNKWFIVLTQSCDLVKRSEYKKTTLCKSEYITIAPVRPLSHFLKSWLEKDFIKGTSESAAFCAERRKVELTRIMERLFNNNEPNYFYLHQEPQAGFDENGCAYLTLGISIKAKEHYDELLSSRILSLDTTFQAKLGWLVGQMYSRVGTEDWVEPMLKREVSAVVDGVAYWVPDQKVHKLKQKIKAIRNDEPDKQLDPDEVHRILNDIPSSRQTALDRIIDIIRNSELNKEDFSNQIKILKAKLEADPVLLSIIKN